MQALGRKTMPDRITAMEMVRLMQSIGEAMQEARALGLAKADAEILISARCALSRAHILAFPERPLRKECITRLQADFNARARGVPVAYLLCEQEFFGLSLSVNENVLIPRPDTETLVEVLLELDVAADAALLDLGTGSGAIALAAKAHRPNWQVHASDRCPAALKIAQGNADLLGLAVVFLQGFWFEPWSGQRFDVIAANPPYIAIGDPHLQEGDLRFEPTSALAAGSDGLADLIQIISKAANHLSEGGWLVLEHGYDQARAVARLLQAAGFHKVALRKDLGGNDRVSFAQIS
jgi:release factor glutamine methyltransferase